MDVSIGAMIGMFGGMICGIFGWWFGRRKAKQQRGLDEVHQHIWQKARSYSWYITLGAIYLFLSLHLFGVELSLAVVLSKLLFIHLGLWAMIGMGLTIKFQYYDAFKVSHLFIGVTIIILSVITFTIFTIVMKDWRFILIGIPFSLIGLLYSIKAKDTTDH